MSRDLHATAETYIDPDTRARLALFAAVINRAIVDAAMPPIKEAAKVRSHRTRFKANCPRNHAKTACYFLFDDKGGLPFYSQWLEIAPDTFRRLLLEHMYDKRNYSKFNIHINDMQKRQFRFNYEWFMHKGNIDESMYLRDDSYSGD